MGGRLGRPGAHRAYSDTGRRGGALDTTTGGVIVVGASGGIGSAVVDELSLRKIAVIGIDLRDHEPEVIGTGGNYRHLTMDAARPETVSRLVAAAEGGDFRHIINVAGGATPEEVREPSGSGANPTLFQETFAANWQTSINAIETAKLLARKARHASSHLPRFSVTLCSSINSIGNFNYPVYSASKAAVESLTSSMCIPLGELGIRVNAVRLGTVVTEASVSLHGESDAHYQPLARLAALAGFPTTRQVAKVIAAVAADFECVTGAVITADNGQSIPGVR